MTTDQANAGRKPCVRAWAGAQRMRMAWAAVLAVAALTSACAERPPPKSPPAREPDRRKTRRDEPTHRTEPPGYGHEVVRSSCADEADAAMSCPDLPATE